MNKFDRHFLVSLLELVTYCQISRMASPLNDPSIYNISWPNRRKQAEKRYGNIVFEDWKSWQAAEAKHFRFEVRYYVRHDYNGASIKKIELMNYSRKYF